MRTRTALLVFLILAGLLLLGYGLGRSSKAQVTRVDSAPIVEAVRKIAKLATVSIEVSDVVRFEEVRTILVFDIPKNAVLRVKGRVMGGFDLDKGLVVRADESSRTLHVELPRPEVLSVDASIAWFDETSRFLNPITPDDRTRWTAWSRGHLARAAKDAGLAQKATAHATELLKVLGESLGWRVVVTVKSAPLFGTPGAPG